MSDLVFFWNFYYLQTRPRWSTTSGSTWPTTGRASACWANTAGGWRPCCSWSTPPSPPSLTSSSTSWTASARVRTRSISKLSEVVMLLSKDPYGWAVLRITAVKQQQLVLLTNETSQFKLECPCYLFYWKEVYRLSTMVHSPILTIYNKQYTI